MLTRRAFFLAAPAIISAASLMPVSSRALPRGLHHHLVMGAGGEVLAFYENGRALPPWEWPPVWRPHEPMPYAMQQRMGWVP